MIMLGKPDLEYINWAIEVIEDDDHDYFCDTSLQFLDELFACRDALEAGKEPTPTPLFDKYREELILIQDMAHDER